MSQPIAKTIEATLEARPTLAERLQRMEEAYASIPEEKREFYKFVFWLLVTLHDVGTHTSTSSIATIQARKQLAYCAHEQLAHFCTVLGFPKRNLAKLAEHLVVLNYTKLLCGKIETRGHIRRPAGRSAKQSRYER